VDRKNAIPLVKVTITMFFLYTNSFSKIMILDKKLWKELICLLSVEGQPTKADSAQTGMGVFFICSVSDTIFAMLFLLKPPADHQWSANHSLRNTAIHEFIHGPLKLPPRFTQIIHRGN
jgi:hypothetical protein